MGSVEFGFKVLVKVNPLSPNSPAFDRIAFA
jgi:hypothetical protein